MVRLVSSRSEAVAAKVTAAPCSQEEPVGGAVMVTVGVEFTTTVIAALALLPPESVTAAVTVWTPEVRALVEREAPVPTSPSWLDDQWMVRLESSRSEAVAVKATLAPCS